jgi:hypothetical protein
MCANNDQHRGAAGIEQLAGGQLYQAAPVLLEQLFGCSEPARSAGGQQHTGDGHNGNFFTPSTRHHKAITAPNHF